MNRSPGRMPGTHYDWNFTQEKSGPGALFKDSEAGQVARSTACLVAMLTGLAAVGAKVSPRTDGLGGNIWCFWCLAAAFAKD
jgi:hypothetical protein